MAEEEVINVDNGVEEPSAEAEKVQDQYDEDVCESCRWREVHLATISQKQEIAANQKKEETKAIYKYLEDKRQADILKDAEAKHHSRKLAQDIHEYNQNMTKSKTQEPKDEQKDAGAYLMYRRPMTAEKDVQKQKDLFEDLSKQVDEKRKRAAAERAMVQSATNSHYLQSQIDLDREESREKDRLERKRLEYRHNLEAQMAANRVESESKPGELWWTTQAHVSDSDSSVKPTVPQVDRVAKQQAAYRNLEEFIKNQNEVDAERKQNEKEKRSEMQIKYTKPETEDPQIKTASEARANRLKLAEEAWQKAFDENEQKKEARDRVHQGGALMDQLSEYRRCKKCHKAIQSSPIGNPGKYWFNGDTNNLHRLDATDYTTLRLRTDASNIKPKSRHFIL